MKLLLGHFLALALWPLSALAGGAVYVDETRLAITYGAFCQLASVGEVPAPGTHADKIDLMPVVPDIRWPGTSVPAVPGISFGVRSTSPEGVIFDPVVIELRHPPFGGIGPSRQIYITRLGGDGASINAYSFDLPEELVTGMWTLRATHDGQVLYEVSFDVVPPALLPQITGGCDGYLGS